jgi:hypothetical protein
MAESRNDDLFPVAFGRETTDEEWNSEADRAQALHDMEEARGRARATLAAARKAALSADAAKRASTSPLASIAGYHMVSGHALESADETLRRLDELLEQPRKGPTFRSPRAVDAQPERPRKPSLWSRLQGQLRRLKAWWDAGWEKPTAPPPPPKP